jgi:molecular chaperone DnaJ
VSGQAFSSIQLLTWLLSSTTSDEHKNEGFLKSVWHKLSGDPGQTEAAVNDAIKDNAKEKDSKPDEKSSDDKSKKPSDSSS